MDLAAGTDRIPGRDLLDRLTDDEIVELARAVAAARGDEGEVARVREVLDGWLTTARIRNHPDFRQNHEAFQRVVGGV